MFRVFDDRLQELDMSAMKPGLPTQTTFIQDLVGKLVRRGVDIGIPSKLRKATNEYDEFARSTSRIIGQTFEQMHRYEARGVLVRNTPRVKIHEKRNPFALFERIRLGKNGDVDHRRDIGKAAHIEDRSVAAQNERSAHDHAAIELSEHPRIEK